MHRCMCCLPENPYFHVDQNCRSMTDLMNSFYSFLVNAVDDLADVSMYYKAGDRLTCVIVTVQLKWDSFSCGG